MIEKEPVINQKQSSSNGYLSALYKKLGLIILSVILGLLAAFYLTKYPSVKRAGFNPLIHYAVRGINENRMINPYDQIRSMVRLLEKSDLFDKEYYNIIPSLQLFSKNYMKNNSSTKNNKHTTTKGTESFTSGTAEMKKMTNIQGINDFYEYTEECLNLIDEMSSQNILNYDNIQVAKEQYIELPFADKIGMKPEQKRLAVFDLDETLIHCELNHNNPSQHKIEILLPCKKIKTIGINIRPNWKEELLKIKKKYYVIVYTASHQSYADSVLNFLDPFHEIFEYRLYRNNCTKVVYEDNTYYIKDLRIFKGVSLKDIVIIDNSVLSFALHMNNGVPILPYYSGEEEEELRYLRKLLLKLAEYEDISKEIGTVINLNKLLNEKLLEETE
jgi:Dullard-like phosphatase family protein